MAKKQNHWTKDYVQSLSPEERTALDYLVRQQEATDTLTKWTPETPWPKQLAFLALDCTEAFYGGAAAGGKSSCLLMDALQYVHLSRFSALILRKDYQRLSLSGGLIPRSHDWLRGKASWNGTDKRWTFPSGAKIQFGYLANATDKFRYGSSEYQYIAFDELTEFPEDDYTFLFSRLRKTKGNPAPLKMRSASNPGGVGHLWVLNRFITDEAKLALRGSTTIPEVSWQPGIYYKNSPTGASAFCPAKIADNPAIDEAGYRANLAHLDPVTRERLMNGDWSILDVGRFKPHWLRYYEMQGENIRLMGDAGQIIAAVDSRTCGLFMRVDPAGTSAEVTREHSGKPHSYSAISLCNRLPDQYNNGIVVRYMWRGRVEQPELIEKVQELYDKWQPEYVGCENTGIGLATYQWLDRCRTINVVPCKPGSVDKLTRASDLLNMAENGNFFIPNHRLRWVEELESELLTWTGHKDETCDQIDCLAYEAMEAASTLAGDIIIQPPEYWR